MGDELVEAQAQLSEHAGRLSKETERRRHLEALLDEGLQVQSQILLGLQVPYQNTPPPSLPATPLATRHSQPFMVGHCNAHVL